MANEHHRLNPWLTMWTKPRATIQQIIDDNPRRFVLLLAALGGIVQALDRASMRSVGDSFDLPIILLIAVVLGSIGGLISLYLGGALVGWTGRWLGGKASYEQIRAAMAWSAVPFLWVSLLWIPELVLFGEELFTTETPRLDDNATLGLLFLAFSLVALGAGLWSSIVFLKSLGQVQGFSAWKALGNSCLAGAAIVVPIAVVVGILVAVGVV